MASTHLRTRGKEQEKLFELLVFSFLYGPVTEKCHRACTQRYKMQGVRFNVISRATRSQWEHWHKRVPLIVW